MRPKALIAWSSGKDSAWALHIVRQSGDYDVVGALTTVNRTFERVAMHGVRQQLLEMQIAAAGLKPVLVHIPHPCTNDIYEKAMAEATAQAKADGITIPLRTSVRYFPLKPPQPRFMPIQHAARAVAARAPAADDLPPDPPSDQTPLPSVMTPEQAQQILSLFSASE